VRNEAISRVSGRNLLARASFGIVIPALAGAQLSPLLPLQGARQ